jgi:hypothetical protein
MTAPCTTLPWPVYRAYSADSLTEIRQYPALGWHWSTANAYMPQGCLTMKQPMAASDFLQHFLTTLPGGVNVVGSMPVAPAFSQWAQHFADVQNQGAAKITFAPAIESSLRPSGAPDAKPRTRHEVTAPPAVDPSGRTLFDANSSVTAITAIAHQISPSYHLIGKT